MAIIARENSSLRRRSGVRNAAANACSTCPPLDRSDEISNAANRRGAGLTAPGSRSRRPGSRRPPRGTVRASWGSPTSDAGGAAPGRADLLGSGRGEGVRPDVDLDAAEVAGAEHLDRLAAADGAGVGQAVRVDRTALREQRRDPVEVDDLEHDLVVVLEARELGQPHVQRGLPTLEPGGGVAASPGALGAATGRLALGALTTTDSRLRGVSAGGRTQVVDLESHEMSLLSFS